VFECNERSLEVMWRAKAQENEYLPNKEFQMKLFFSISFHLFIKFSAGLITLRSEFENFITLFG
jgi:hypothetical protein